MEPGEALSTAAQIAVALAVLRAWWSFFGGSQFTTGRRSTNFGCDFCSPIQFLPLALCIIALVFLTIQPALTGVWRWCSSVAFVAFAPFAITTTMAFRRFGLQRLQGAPANFIFYLFATLGTAATLLQLYNVALLGAFWPFFTGIVLQLVAAMFQFARMILLPPK